MTHTLRQPQHQAQPSRRSRFFARTAALTLCFLLVGAFAAQAGDWNREGRKSRAELPLIEGSSQPFTKLSATDPVGDTFGTGSPQLDLTNLSGTVVGSDIEVELTFAAAISAPDSGQANAVDGFIDIDVDQDGNTGDQPWTDFFGPGANTGMGNEFYVDFFTYSSGDGAVDLVDEVSELAVGRVPMTVSGTTVTVQVPISLLGDDGSVNLATIVGTVSEATDYAPNTGSVQVSGLGGLPSILLNDGRFRVSVNWSTPTRPERPALVSNLRTDDSGIFYFDNPENLEFLIKVLDACNGFDRYWVFFAATTNVEFTVRVEDLQDGQVNTYFNPFGQPADAITDTQAFATCP